MKSCFWKLLAAIVLLPLPSGEGWGEGLAAEKNHLLCCGGPEVFVISADDDKADRLWSWQAKDSPEIPEQLRGQFRTTDDCKPYDGGRLLITSSSGGVALVRREDKKCLFHATAKNAHSACLLPKERLAVASSYGGDELLIFSLAAQEPIARMKLIGAHGTVWDEKRSRLWTLGGEELLLVEIRESDEKIELVAEARWDLPTEGGHDLVPTRDARFFFVTTDSGVYRFDTEDRKFAPFQPLADVHGVKSIAEHPRTGRIVYHQADLEKKTWWSDTLRFLEPSATKQLRGEKLYKVRWDLE